MVALGVSSTVVGIGDHQVLRIGRAVECQRRLADGAGDGALRDCHAADRRRSPCRAAAAPMSA